MTAVLLALALALAACCRAGQRDPEPEALAVIVDPTPASRAALSQAVRAALGGAPVLLADDALTRDPLLIIERAPHRDPSGLPAQGRELGMPERFHLLKSGGRCVLVHERTGTRSPLAATSCVPVTRRSP